MKKRLMLLALALAAVIGALTSTPTSAAGCHTICSAPDCCAYCCVPSCAMPICDF